MELNSFDCVEKSGLSHFYGGLNHFAGAPHMSLPDDLAKLAQLHKDGHLTEEEYTLAKRKVLADEPLPKPSPAEAEPASTPPPAPPASPPIQEPWTAIDQTVVAESEPIRRAQRRGTGSFAIIAMWILAFAHFIGFVRVAWYSGKSSFSPDTFGNYEPLISQPVIIVLVAIQACVFLTLAILSFRQPLYCASISLCLFLLFGIGKTALDFYEAHQMVTAVESSAARDRSRDGLQTFPTTLPSHLRVVSVREQVFERLYTDYGVGWSFRLVLVVMLCLGIYDSRRVQTTSA
jgi:hypothetical protein